ncbi:histidine phosphatase family protein [soil metagenome]
MKTALRVLALAAWLVTAPAMAADPTEAQLLKALSDGRHVGLMRHSSAPGIGDPPEFKLGDCATQRNLSDTGRAEARAMGQKLRQAGVTTLSIHSSQWCRCLDTAMLLDFGAVKSEPALNSFFQRDGAEPQSVAVRALVAAAPRRPSLLLVTHQVNITELTGVNPASGAIVVVAPTAAGWKTLGTIAPATVGP